MNSGKIENELNLALDIPEQERIKTYNLDVGYSAITNTWELIVKYSGDISFIEDDYGISVVELLNGYAIITAPEEKIDQLSEIEQIEFIEKPKRVYFEVNQGRAVSCINPVQLENSFNLLGNGTLVAIIDSGIDYSHIDFRNLDGTTRIVALWDQTRPGNPPLNYDQGTIYTREMINEALALPMPVRMSLVPSVDLSGHGTHVAGIAAGNGRASNGLYRGVAPLSELIVVKLGTSIGDSFPRTTQLMTGIDFAIRTAISLNKPLAINLSFGNNYGSHTGRTLLETYINDVSNQGKINVVIGTGNEGVSGNHTQGILKNGETSIIEISVSEANPTFSLQIWKNYYDKFDITFISPSGLRVGPIPRRLGTQQFIMNQTKILLYYGDPTPFNAQQEIYVEFVPLNLYVNSGFWKLELTPQKIVTGDYDMWLPTGGTLGADTRFLAPSVFTTLTIPSTAYRAITVGAYDGYTDSYAPFSGRGYTRNLDIKPDLVAPGVNIMSCSPGGGYTARTGTSMATPFVAGSAALLMEWGIVRNNDPYLYGEKLKAYLIDGCRPLRIENIYPNRTLGYGALCLQNTFNNIIVT
ncbi:S8 family peptidase [Lacrimispora saccharolytica]|uniref:Peptidase S8 and S53 subtilisin kexin sedolisin n=1 Tax=Lacrimispora saccharolytica (strain ATCC 35040 / DSM 2544 / NRCC 2533 / WM1) TaxID=610130 RepID=D9R951_LACSW|nr:S8 family peptidase [Lacrimispora saccharolytica]ADL04026.1 peptidase S8 and S53 subtilisin kexin sedolisin [[Clostridium] saccharolyticum WM1]QRV21675.1 S8 family serine peptidase [Lacrimispora saccharolytica]